MIKVKDGKEQVWLEDKEENVRDRCIGEELEIGVNGK